jgi:hypothetical protein
MRWLASGTSCEDTATTSAASRSLTTHTSWTAARRSKRTALPCLGVTCDCWDWSAARRDMTLEEHSLPDLPSRRVVSRRCVCQRRSRTSLHKSGTELTVNGGELAQVPLAPQDSRAWHKSVRADRQRCTCQASAGSGFALEGRKCRADLRPLTALRRSLT